MWCPVFLQTEDKVGVSALTESWTCFRPYTDHAVHTYKHFHAYMCLTLSPALLIHNTDPLHG